MGNDIFKSVVQGTGLPEEVVERELGKILEIQGIAIGEVTVDELRAALAQYLRDTLSMAKDKFEDGVWIEEEIGPDEIGLEDTISDSTVI